MPGIPVAQPYGRFVCLDASDPDARYALISETRGKVARAANLEWLMPVYRIAARNALGIGKIKAEPRKPWYRQDQDEGDRPRLDFAIFKWREGDAWELVVREVELNDEK